MIQQFKNKQQAIKTLKVAIQFNCIDIYRKDFLNNTDIKDNDLSHYHVYLHSVGIIGVFQNYNNESPWCYIGNKIQKVILTDCNNNRYIEMFIAVDKYHKFIYILNCYNIKYKDQTEQLI